MPGSRRYVAVVGPAAASLPAADAEELLAAAHETGRLLAAAGCVVLCGGGTGVMAAAADGAAAAGGLSVGLLPGPDRSEAHPSLTVALATGLGELRNGLLVRAADALVAVGCSWGTLSEIALAVRTGVPVHALRCWDLPPGVHHHAVPAAAVAAALQG